MRKQPDRSMRVPWQPFSKTKEPAPRIIEEHTQSLSGLRGKHSSELSRHTLPLGLTSALASKCARTPSPSHLQPPCRQQASFRTSKFELVSAADRRVRRIQLIGRLWLRQTHGRTAPDSRSILARRLTTVERSCLLEANSI